MVASDAVRDDAGDLRPGLLTFGHGTAGQEELRALLADAGVGVVVDVRRFPGSRRHPHVGRDALAQWLPDAGIAYRWDQRLGGRRRTPAAEGEATAAVSDLWWRVESFRAYATHTRTPEFGDAMLELLAGVARVRTVVMCSESLWWRCHRRLIADVATLVHHVPVLHLDHRGGVAEHEPSAGARRTSAGLVYDGPAT